MATLRPQAALTLQKEFDALTPTQAADRASISSHSSPFVLLQASPGSGVPLEPVRLTSERCPAWFISPSVTVAESVAHCSRCRHHCLAARDASRSVACAQTVASSERRHRALPRAACNERLSRYRGLHADPRDRARGQARTAQDEGGPHEHALQVASRASSCRSAIRCRNRHAGNWSMRRRLSAIRGIQRHDARQATTRRLDAASLRWPTPIVRDRRHIGDRDHLQASACSARIAASRPAPGPRT